MAPQYYCVGRSEAERTLREVDPDGFGWYDGLIQGFKDCAPWFKSLTVLLGALDVVVIAAIVLIALVVSVQKGVLILWEKVSAAARKR